MKKRPPPKKTLQFKPCMAPTKKKGGAGGKAGGGSESSSMDVFDVDACKRWMNSANLEVPKSDKSDLHEKIKKLDVNTADFILAQYQKKSTKGQMSKSDVEVRKLVDSHRVSKHTYFT